MTKKNIPCRSRTSGWWLWYVSMYLTAYTAMRLPMIPMIRAMMMEN